MSTDKKQLLKFFSNQLLIVLSVLSILTSIYFLLHIEKELAYGTIGAIVGILLATISARYAEKTRDKILVGLSIAASFYFQFSVLTP